MDLKFSMSSNEKSPEFEHQIKIKWRLVASKWKGMSKINEFEARKFVGALKRNFFL